MDYYLFQISSDSSVEEIQLELEKKGLTDAFIIEDDATGEIFVGGHSKKKIQTSNAQLIEKKKAVVDWEEQWALFAENFIDGKAHIDLNGKSLLLTPGAGFGDLSHPTTYLMIEMLKNHLQTQPILDIGTGSGILALSALLLGAKSAIGIDIDTNALKHAKENAKLNQLKATFSKTLPKKIPKKNIILMNMIFPEQKEFEPQRLNSLATLWIVSGILEEQKEEYLKQAIKWGWELMAEYKKSQWIGFVFTTKEQP